MKNVRAVAFDFNGVIIDDEGLHAEALMRAFRPRGIAIDRETYWERYLALDDAGAVDRIIADHPGRVPPGEAGRIVEEKIGLYMGLLEALPAVPFFPGAIEAVKSLSRAFPMVIVSGARRAEIEAVLARGGIAGCFRAVVSCEDTERSKPDPAPYRRGLEILGAEPSAVVAIEDSLGGVESARAAGLSVVAVEHSYPRERLGRAHTVVRDVRAAAEAILGG